MYDFHELPDACVISFPFSAKVITPLQEELLSRIVDINNIVLFFNSKEIFNDQDSDDIMSRTGTDGDRKNALLAVLKKTGEDGYEALKEFLCREEPAHRYSRLCEKIEKAEMALEEDGV